MNTLVLTRRFSPPWFNGNASYARGLVDVLSHMSAYGHQTSIDIFSLMRETENESALQEELQSYTRNRGARLIFSRKSEERSPSPVEAIRWLNRNNDYDNVHIVCDGLGPFFANSTLRRMNPGRMVRLLKHLYIVPVHYLWPLEMTYFRVLQNGGLCPQLTYVYSCSELERRYRTRDNWLLPPAIDTDLFRPSNFRREAIAEIFQETDVKIGNLEKVLEKEKIVLYFGPVTRDRFPFDHLLKALLLDRNRFSETGVLVVGRGFERGKFLKEITHGIKKHNLSESIFLTLKCLTEDQKIHLLNLCDVFFYPFLNNALRLSVVAPPIALLEAMATGTTVITGGLSFLHSMIRDRENGFLIQKVTAHGIAEALEMSLENNSKAVSKLARDTIKTAYSIESVARKLGDYLNESLKS